MKRKSTEQVAALAANGTTNDPFAGIGDIRRTKQATQNVTIWTGKMKFRNGVRANIEMTAIKDTEIGRAHV